MNNNSIIISLVQNVALLLAMALIFDITMKHWDADEFSFRQVLVGFVIGGIGITLMMTPWQFVPGIIFDTRSILLSISGLFIGLVPTAIAVLMTAAFRIYQGGAATVMGVSVIVATASLGVIWRYWRKKSLFRVQWYEFYVFGLVNHIVMLLLTFTLPLDTALEVLRAIALPVMIIYPLGTAFLGELMAGRFRRERLVIDLKTSEERLRLAVKAAHIGFFERNFQTGEAIYSREWKEQIGYAEDELPNVTCEWENRVHPEDFPRVLEKVKACGDGTSRLYEAEYRLRHKDGSYRWILARGNVQFDQSKHPLRLVGCHIDITAFKQVEAALKTSKEQYQVLTENIKDVVWVLDVGTFYFRYVSPSVEKLRGHTVEEIMAVPVDFALMPEAGAQLKELIRQRAQELVHGKIDSFFYFTDEVEQPCKDGSTVWTEVITNYYTNLQTGKVEILGVTRDISERRAAQEKINQLNLELEQRVRERTAQLQAANQELEAFAYSVSHDLRAPLRAIDGFSAALQEDYQHVLDDQGMHYFDRIREAASRMSELINDLLSLSRVTRSDLIPLRVDLSEIAQSVADELIQNNPDRKVEVVIEPGMQITADPRLIRIVIENLLNNAFKFSAARSPAQIKVGYTQQKGTVAYFVQDNGVGFDMAYADKLFAPFQRLHSMQEFAGTGIGLVTVKRIITRHGGKVWIEAAPDAGAIFYFTLGDSHE